VNRIAGYAVEALDVIWRHRGRSFLTILGMAVGTASIIAVLGISRAAQAGIASTLGAFGDPGIVITVDPDGDDPNAARIQPRDVRTILESNPQTIARGFPLYERTYRLQANGIAYDTFAISGSDYAVDNRPLAFGRRIDRADVGAAARVCVITQDLARRFFHSTDAVGREIRIRGVRFRIIGVYTSGANALSATLTGSEYAELPYSTFEQIAPGPADFLEIYPAPGAAGSDASDGAIRTLRRLHGPHARYVVLDNKALLDGFNRSLRLVADGLAAVGAISLLVAGIGIMNVMLVSVTERTKEIGLRKSIGASRRDIALQFLLESVMLSLIGGAAGTIVGIGVTLAAYAAVTHYVGRAPVPYALVVSLAAGFSMLVGIAFGTYPALRAGRMDPSAALRA
jgi:putative ABC transport system permease protein